MKDKKNISYDMIIVTRFNTIFNTEHSMMADIIIGIIEKKMNYVTIITLLSTYLFLFINFILVSFLHIILIILVMILGFDLILLHYNIYFEIIIPDKIKEIYDNGYWMKGYILDGDLIIDIDEFFLNSEDLEKYKDEVINKYLEGK